MILYALYKLLATFLFISFIHRAPVAQLVENRAAMREVVSSTPTGPTLRVLK